MANNDLYTTAVRCCKEVGIQPPSSRSAFNDDNMLTSPQLKMKLFVDKSNRILIRTLNKKFTQRLFSFTTTANDYNYDLDSLTCVDSILYHSFRCNTTNSATPLRNLEYNTFREMYPDTSLITTGKPQFWIVEPVPSSSGSNRTNSVRILPTPDAVYTIEYQAKVSAQPLSVDTDVIVWPVDYEDVLWTYAEEMMENKLGVDATAAQYADMAVNALRMWAERPTDERRGVRFRVSVGSDLRRGHGGGRYENPFGTAGW